MSAMLIQAADRVGNFRVHGATLGVADNIGWDKGFVVVIFRGQYDRAAAKALLTDKALARGAGMGGGVTVEKVGEIEAIFPDREVCILLPSDEQLILLAAPKRDQMPLQEIADALRTGKGKLSENAEMAKLVKSVDAASTAWCVLKVTDAYKAEPDFAQLLGPFKQVVGQVKVGKDQIDLTVKATGENADETAKVVEFVSKGIEAAKAELAREVGKMPMLQSLADAVATVKVVADGGNATVTAQYKGSLVQLVAMPMMLFMNAPGGRPEPPMIDPVPR
ncbi:MAG: hypothetical protein PHU85_11475 [Phycisphaerae bacterium]|nr:hypothetical protein [Phycisphaerae bacterium]